MDKNSDIELKNFLNSNENLEIPEEISNGINKVLNKIEKRQKFKRWMKGGSIAASLLILITIGLGAAFPALAEQAAVITRILGKESFFNRELQSSFYKSDISNVQNNSIAVGQTSTHNGISVTMKEIAYDGTALYAVYQVKSDVPNDKLRNVGNISIGGETTDFVGDNLIAIQTIDNNTVQFVQMFIISGEEKLADKFNVSINFTELLFKKGNWSFNMILDKNELAKDSKLTDLNKVVNFNSGKANVRTLAQSSTFATLTVDYDNYNRNKDYNNFSLIDNYGTELQQIEFATQEIKKGEKTEVITVYKVSKDTIIKKVVANQSTSFEYPYPQKFKDFTYVDLNTNFPKTVIIGPGKEITINSISLKEDYTTIPHSENSKYKYYVFTITAEDLSIQDYVSNGGITIYHNDMAKTKYGAYNYARANVVGNNTYEISFIGKDASKMQATNCVLAFIPYDEVLNQRAEIDIK
ncbi:DUF4179 domain-containing protein [Candidatus Clostridium radicumherbarum]|uniref:DUF4179 domain-containing protein n=1 Tax=Candidatus Clostridium radicumherbarum TaxID=3381662 RepID=A0ABW8TS90_9CLOT